MSVLYNHHDTSDVNYLLDNDKYYYIINGDNEDSKRR